MYYLMLWFEFIIVNLIGSIIVTCCITW